MDKWKYYDISHKQHLLCNPMSKEKFERLCRLLQLEKGSRVLDIACGKGELLVRLAELYNIEGVGVDISPYHTKDFLEKVQARVPDSNIVLEQIDGAKYKPESDEHFDLTMCIGADWIFNGTRGTMQALKGMTKKGGLIVIGDIFWLKEPPKEYLEGIDYKMDEIGSHHDNIKIGEGEGLTCLYTIESDLDDWDHYEGLQWWAADEHVRNNPDDPDNPDLLERVGKQKETYLKWERGMIGWAIYVFRKD